MNQVLFCIDKRMVMPLLVVLRSMEGLADGLEITVLSVGLSDSQKSGLVARSPAPMRIIEIDDVIPQDFPDCMWLTRAAYGRLWVEDFYDSSVERVVYLDSDIIVRDKLDFLFEIDLEEHAIGACQAMALAHFKDELGLDWRRLNLDPWTPYINSGVLVIDLKKYREQKIRERCIEFIRDNKEHLNLADQDALNFVLLGKFKRLPPRWNQESVSRTRELPVNYKIYTAEEIDDLVDRPAIIHFNGSKKPWSGRSNDPYAKDWLALRDEIVDFSRGVRVMIPTNSRLIEERPLRKEPPNPPWSREVIKEPLPGPEGS